MSVLPMTRMVLFSLAVCGAVSCMDQRVVCAAGTAPCGTTCINAQNDPLNCGGCQIACAANQACESGVCACQGGAVACNGACSVLAVDSRNCGSCGNACSLGQVCNSGKCESSCVAGVASVCGSSCVNFATDPANCGTCGNVCGSGLRCRASQCSYDFVAACTSNGSIVPFNATTFGVGSGTPLGRSPQSLALKDGTLLSADGLDQRLYQARVSDAGLVATSRATQIGKATNQVVVDGPFAFVVNAGDNTIQVLATTSTSGVLTLADGGAPALTLGTVDEVNLGENTWPEGIAIAGGTLWVPLYGGTDAVSADAGQSVVQLAVSDAGKLTELARVDLRTLDLQPFEGRQTWPRPQAITEHGGAIYVALNNLNRGEYSVGGPGLLARIDPATRVVTRVELGGQQCLNPVWLASVGEELAVSCFGSVTWNDKFVATASVGAGVVLLDKDAKVRAVWSAACPGDAGTDSACAVFLPSRFSVRGTRLAVGDANSGRLILLDVSDAGLAPVRGVGSPINICPGPGVSDVLAVP